MKENSNINDNCPFGQKYFTKYLPNININFIKTQDATLVIVSIKTRLTNHNLFFLILKFISLKIHFIPPIETLSIDDQQVEEEKTKTPDAIPTVKLDGKSRIQNSSLHVSLIRCEKAFMVVNKNTNFGF